MRSSAEGWEGEGGIHSSQITSDHLCPATDLWLASPQQLEIWAGGGLNPLLGISTLVYASLKGMWVH